MADQNGEQGNGVENTSIITSLSEENGEQGIGNAQGGPVNHNEPMQDEGSRRSGYGRDPFLCRAVSVFPHPARDANGRPQFYYVMVRVPTVMLDQIGNIYHQEHSYGSLPPQTVNHRIPGRGMVHHVARSNHIGAGVMHQTNPRANSLSLNVRVPQHQPQQHFSVSYSRGPRLGHYQHARPSSSAAGLSSNRFIPDPTSSSRPSSSTHAGLSSVDEARFSRMSSRNTSLARLSNEQNPFEPQHGHENTNRVSPIAPSPIIHTVSTRESINMQNQAGIEMRREPVELKCNLCNGNLRLAPGNIEPEPPFQPEVSVFSCGHAYHSECFGGSVRQEQSADTPCYFCTLHRT